MPDSKVEVKACPFCGSQAIYKIEQPRMDSDNLPKYCKCSNGPCCASKIFWPIEQWNTRSPIANNGVSFDSIVDKLTHLNGDHLIGLELNDIHIIANFITKLPTTAPRGGDPLNILKRIIKATPHSMCSDAEAWAIAEQLITEGDVIGG